MDQKICIVCGKPLHYGKLYCSHNCRASVKRNYKTCVVCGKPFRAAPSSGVLTCSPECRKINNSRSSSVPENLASLDQNRTKYIQETAPENRQTAKIWVLRSPKGLVYEVKNLIQFFRDHAELIDCAPETAARGIVAVKSSMTGKRKKNACRHWKGWTLDGWDDCGVAPRGQAEVKRAEYANRSRRTITPSLAAKVKAQGTVTTKRYIYNYDRVTDTLSRTPLGGGEREEVYVREEINHDP